jgi:hypothetical protein
VNTTSKPTIEVIVVVVITIAIVVVGLLHSTIIGSDSSRIDLSLSGESRASSCQFVVLADHCIKVEIINFRLYIVHLSTTTRNPTPCTLASKLWSLLHLPFLAMRLKLEILALDLAVAPK